MSNPLNVIVSASTARVQEATVDNSLVITAGVGDGEMGRIYLGGKRLADATVDTVARSRTHPGAIVTIDGRKFAIGGFDGLTVTVGGQQYTVHGDDQQFVFAGPIDKVHYDRDTDTIS